METSLIEQEELKPFSKESQVLPSGYHLVDRKFVGYVRIGDEAHYTEYFDTREEADLELRCLEKKLNYELIETVDKTTFHPERAKLIEEAYQASGRTTSLYTGLMLKDVTVSDNTSEQ